MLIIMSSCIAKYCEWKLGSIHKIHFAFIEMVQIHIRHKKLNLVSIPHMKPLHLRIKIEDFS